MDRWIGIAIFAVTYVLVSARRLGWLRLDRPAGALVGAVACVVAGVLGPDDALRAIDGRTLILLFGMMGMGAFLGVDGFFDRAAVALAGWAKSPQRLLAVIVWSCGGLAALVTNDAVCVLAAPLVVELVKRHRLPPLPFLLAVATASNTGSVATLVGNPQNMLCASLGGLEYRDHLVLMAPVAVLCLALNHGLLVLFFRRQLGGRLEAARGDRVVTAPVAVTLAVIGATVILYTAGADLAWTAAGGCAVLLVLRRPEPGDLWKRVDWSILLFFAGLFVVVEALVRTGAPEWVFRHLPLERDGGPLAWAELSAVFLVGSNVVSNVPFIMVVRPEMASLPDPRVGWELLAMASTFAGNLTLLGSVANIIVAEKGREVGGLGFWQYLRVGLPLALLTTIVGTAWVVFFTRAF
jgi:Na+/H+ antiporter NhaD/arsenite permease-like protein